MEFEKRKLGGIERIIEIDNLIKANITPNNEVNAIIEEKVNILMNFTEAEIQQFISYTMSILKNKKTRAEVESDIRHLISNLKINN